jgi:bifunctional ADP-heptose synthase (sugar kinase/adenylyltransferase)
MASGGIAVLTDAVIKTILARLPSLTIGVLGDLFLDRYLDLDGTLTEPSVETGLDAYQVVRVRSYPGAAGTVINNLVALCVGRVCPIAVIGDDGEGYELRQALARMPTVDPAGIISVADRRTPTYTKPMLAQPGLAPRELNRLDIKNRTPTPRALQERIAAALEAAWPAFDALVVLDQVSEAECGVVTSRIRELLAEKGNVDATKLILADSRERIGLFRMVALKPNEHECLQAVGLANAPVDKATVQLAHQVQRPVFCTSGDRGIRLTRPGDVVSVLVPAYPVSGPIDPVGAGDSTSAGIVCAAAAGATLQQAAAFGNLVASITVQQIGTTGTATPEQVRQRWREVASSSKEPRTK